MGKTNRNCCTYNSKSVLTIFVQEKNDKDLEQNQNLGQESGITTINLNKGKNWEMLDVIYDRGTLITKKYDRRTGGNEMIFGLRDGKSKVGIDKPKDISLRSFTTLFSIVKPSATPHLRHDFIGHSDWSRTKINDRKVKDTQRDLRNQIKVAYMLLV